MHPRTLLRLDAVYCAAAGAIALLLSVPLGRLFHVAPALVAAVGLAALAWAALLAGLAWRRSRRRAIRLVAGVNVAASVAVLGLAVAAPTVAARLLLLAVAVEVAAFAAAQMRTLG